MSEKISHSLSEWFDDDALKLTSTDDALVEQSSESIAESILVHGLLSDLGQRDNSRDSARIQALMQALNEENSEEEVTTELDNSLIEVKQHSRATIASKRKWFAILSSALAIAAGVTVLFFLVGPNQNVSAATTSLEKVLEAAAKPFDRTYRLKVVEEYPTSQDFRKPQRGPRRPVRFKDEINNALLHVGGIDRFVFSRELKDGQKRVSGCDGLQSWAFREDSPVHISSDLHRYRGGLPGQQHNLGFTDLYSQITSLQEGYSIKLSKLETKNSNQSLQRITGEHRSVGIGGPKRVEIDFDPVTGVIHRMFLDELPRGKGGPKSVEFDLISQDQLDVGFYSHNFHHEPEKQVKYEDKRQ